MVQAKDPLAPAAVPPPSPEAAIEPSVQEFYEAAETAEPETPTTEVQSQPESTEGAPAPAAEAVQPATEEKKSSEKKPRVFTEEEVAKIQSQADKRTAALEAEKRQLLARQNEQALQAQIEGYKQSLVQAYSTQGYSAEDAGKLAQRDTDRAVALHRAEQAERERANIAVRSAALIVATQYGLSQDDLPSLLVAQSPEEMQGIAEKRAIDRRARQGQEERIKALEAEIAALKQGRVPAGTRVESGVTQPAGTTTQEQMFARFRSGDRSPEVTRFMDSYMNKRG